MTPGLVLDRPAAWLDLETTGVAVETDRIVEIAVVVHYPPGGAETYRSVRRINPGVPISKEATEVHGITDADVAGCPTFRQVARALSELLEPCAFVGFGITRFDLPMLRAEFKRAGITFDPTGHPIIDEMQLFHRLHPRDLTAAARHYAGMELGDDAHSAEADTDVLPAILLGMLELHPDLPRDLAGLAALCHEIGPYRGPVQEWFGDDLTAPVMQKGQNVKGKTLREVVYHDAGFIAWMMKQPGIDEEVKDFIRDFRREMHGAAR